MNLSYNITILSLVLSIAFFTGCSDDSESSKSTDTNEENLYSSVDCSSEINFTNSCINDPFVTPEENDDRNCQILSFTSDLESQIYIISIGINNTMSLAKDNYENNTQFTLIGAENLETDAVADLGNEAKIQSYSIEDAQYLFLRTRKSNALVSIVSTRENGSALCTHNASEMKSVAQKVLDNL